MKRYLFFTLPIFLVLAVVGWILFQRPTDPPPPMGQEKTVVGTITMLPSTQPVNLNLQRRVGEILGDRFNQTDQPITDTFVITDVSKRDQFYYVSVAGMPSWSDRMRLEDAVWLGMVVVGDTPSMPGYIMDTAQPGKSAASTSDQPGTGRGGSQNILPFRSGTTAQYGTLGVHGCGFGLNGWKAVDLFPSENQVYATQEGEISYVCRDSTQVSIRIGDNLYAHLVDTGQQVGDSYTQAQPMGALVTGTFNDTCGYADQQAGSAHVHFCFAPNGGGTWSADGYALSVINGNWVKGSDTVAPGGTLTASWTNAQGENIPAKSAVGGNFWDGIASGIVQLFRLSITNFPEHQARGIADRVMTTAGPVMVLVHTIAFRLFDMTVPLWVFGIILAMEAVRIVYSIYMWIKRAIPVIG